MNKNISSKEKHLFKMLIELTTESGLIDNSSIKATDKYILEQYLSNYSIEIIATDIQQSENLVKKSINDSVSSLSLRISELINKENYFKENLNKKQPLVTQQVLNLYPGAQLITGSPLSSRAKRVLAELNVICISDLNFLSVSSLEKLKATGKKTITEIIDLAMDYNIVIK
jgi:hypothetical protein